MQNEEVTVLGIDDLGRLGVSKSGRLYWDARPVITEHRLEDYERRLAFWFALVTGASSVVIAADVVLNWVTR